MRTVKDAFAEAEAVDLDGETAAPADEGPEGDLPPPSAYFDAEGPEARGATYPLNDYGNGLRLVEYYGEDFRFVPRLGWYRWDGRRWASDEDEFMVRRDAQGISARVLNEIPFIALEDWQREALDLWRKVKKEHRELSDMKASDRAAAQAARLIELEAIRAAGEPWAEYLKKAAAAHRAHAKNSGNTSKISNMLAEAKTAVATEVGAMNADPLMLCCENGVLHFSLQADDHGASWGGPAKRPHVDLLPHDRRHLISKMARAEYHADAACPTWDAFLERVQPDREVRDFLQRWFGYCLTGKTTEQKLAFFYGGGRNGKSTAVDVIARIMDDYGSTLPIETLTGSEQRKGSDATPDLVRLPGARFVRASEPEQGQKMKEALIKALTGGEPIMIRRMMQEFVEIHPEFKLTISGNHRPEVRGSDDGIWRRILLVPFTEQIPADEVDPMLPEKLWAERAGILAWMVRGCLAWMQGGLRAPQCIAEATEDYRRDSDPMRVFLETECEISGTNEHFERGRDLSDAFNAWLLHQGFSTWGKRTIANGFKARANNVKGKTGHVYTPAKRSDTGYLGIRLNEAARDRIAAFSDEIRRSG